MDNIRAGVCAIKEEFIIKRPDKKTNEDETNSLGKHKLEEVENDSSDSKKSRSDDGNQKTYRKDKSRGQNKVRPKTFHDDKQNKPCPTIVNLKSADDLTPCKFNNCKYIHDALDYLKSKPTDIGENCHLFTLRGRCPRGITCRFGACHLTAEGFNIVDEEKYKNWKDDTKNTLQNSLQFQLQKRKYDFNLAERLVKATDCRKKNVKCEPAEPIENKEVLNDIPVDIEKVKCESAEPKKNKELLNDIPVDIVEKSSNGLDNSTHVVNSGAITDEDLIKLLPREKKTIDWRDKLYLSPLTTVGNLPFRRICKEFGVDITCGEMALCESMLKGHKQEWALVKRHECEDIFGAQICGNNAYGITKVAQLLQENTELDFIDLNLGCPIDLIYKQGGGSGMMHRLSTLEASVRCASRLLTIPFTVKMRTGVYQNKKIAHSIMPQVGEWGASLITLHGRSREGRYTRSADWEYIETCAKAAAPCPVFGNGDILCYDDYVERRAIAPSVQGVMIGRGALIKPWIFTEIKEQRLWDIRSSERFEILKKYRNYGLEHWGSDTQGVENTRRFLLEWLSFLYRYVPVGLLETPPQKINERPPSYFGRDDLETLMASGNCADWIKISEMLLGPVPDRFKFLPKHKANSY